MTGESSNRFGTYSRTYGLDAAFNRTGATGSNGQNPSWSRTLTGNSNNQITGSTFSQNGTTSNTGYTYDGEGNRTSVTSGDTTTFYDFDAQQRLSQVRRSTGGAAATVQMKAGYSSDGLRAWKEDAQGVRTYFLYDGDQLVGEFDQSGMMQASQTWGTEGLSYRRTASGASAGNRFYSWDVRGNVAATTDSTGAVVNTPSSDGFSSSGGSEPCATFGGQVGGYRDGETGLILFGQRYYDPSLGSWLTRDPIAENGGINLYSYVQGNPVNGLDPSGLQTTTAPAGYDILNDAASVSAKGASLRFFGVIGMVLGDAKPLGDDSMGPTIRTQQRRRAAIIAKFPAPPQFPPPPPGKKVKRGDCPEPGDSDYPQSMRGRADKNQLMADLMQWGRGSSAPAEAAIALLNRANLKKAGLTYDMARKWYEMYDCHARNSPGNPAAPGRRKLMWYAMQLLK